MIYPYPDVSSPQMPSSLRPSSGPVQSTEPRWEKIPTSTSSPRADQHWGSTVEAVHGMIHDPGILMDSVSTGGAPRNHLTEMIVNKPLAWDSFLHKLPQLDCETPAADTSSW